MEQPINVGHVKSDETHTLKCLVYEQLHEGLSKRQSHSRGITDAIPISRVIGVDTTATSSLFTRL